MNLIPLMCDTLLPPSGQHIKVCDGCLMSSTVGELVSNDGRSTFIFSLKQKYYSYKYSTKNLID